MPSWGAILRELNDLQKKDPQATDLVRRKYIATLHAYTKRAVILYATKWMEPDGIPPGMLSVNNTDMQGFMECINGVKEQELDLILHSPGGDPAAAEACIHYLRAKFSHIRVIVPYAAMSAATMMACAADEIVMGKHSFLGPIDPQLILQTSLGPRSIPAQGILDQFDKAKTECADPRKLAVWLPMLQQYGPDLLVTCTNVLSMSKEIVTRWLASYMLKGESEANPRAERIASWLADHGSFKMHSRYIPREELKARGLKIADLESDKQLQDAVLSIFHATTHTFNMTEAAKIIENHRGNATIQQMQQVIIQQQGAQPARPLVAPKASELPPFPKKKGH
jgi:hypothetical protein